MPDNNESKPNALTEPQTPKYGRAAEEGRINPAFTNITQGEKFTPMPGVSYLWVYNEKKEIVIGIEKPEQHPEAFNIDLKDEKQRKVWETIKASLREGDAEKKGLGHPTLGAGFFDHGQAKQGRAYLGGELNFSNEQNTWILNNKSGRYGRCDEVNPQAQQKIENTLQVVAKEFAKAGVTVTPQLLLREPKIESSILFQSHSSSPTMLRK